MFQHILRYIRLNILSLANRYPLETTDFNQIEPVFILSSGRSGSTLLRKIILRSGFISIPPETHGFIPAVTFCFLKNNHKPWPEIICHIVDLIDKKHLLKQWNISLKAEDINNLKFNFNDKSLSGILFFFYNLYSKANHPEAIYWGDKTPILITHIDLLKKIFPNAKYIFLIRDGRDVISSFIKNNIYTDIKYLSSRWIKSIHVIRKLQNNRPEKVYLVHYESIVSHPEEETAKICFFLKIPYNPLYIENSFVYMGDDHQSHFMDTKQNIHTGNIGKWKSNLSDVQIKKITKLIYPILKREGYI